MKAIILVGGLGTRLRPLTASRPKPLLPILNRPFFTYQLDLLKKGGVTEVALAVGRFIPQWKKAVREWAPNGLRVKIIRETKPLGTGGAIRHAFDKAFGADGGKDPLAVLNGDVFLSLDVKKFIEAARRVNAEGAIAVHRVKDASAFGLVEFDHRGRVKAFREKPKKPRPGWINAGAYLLSPALIRTFPKKPHSIERDVFPQVLRKKIPLAAHRLSGYWNDIGTIPTYLSAHEDLVRQNLYWTKAGTFGQNGAPAKFRQTISRSRKNGIFVGKTAGSSVSAGFLAEGFVFLGPKTKIGPNCFLKNTVLMNGAQVGAGCILENVVLGEKARIDEYSVLRGPLAIGDKSRITAYSRIGR